MQRLTSSPHLFHTQFSTKSQNEKFLRDFYPTTEKQQATTT